MRSQLTSAIKLCSTAENALLLGEVQLAHGAVEKATHTAQWVRAHLKEPNHVPADSVASIGDQLAELETRISKVETQFQS